MSQQSNRCGKCVVTAVLAVFAQKAIRLQRAVIRDRTVGYARKFVQNPVTAIVKKIESRGLDRRPGYRLPYATVEGDESCRSDAIDDRCGSGRATFVPMMESADLGKCNDLAS